MSTTDFALEASSRSIVGKGASRRLRREQDIIPAIVYGGGQDPQTISMPHSLVLKASESEAFYSKILTLLIDGNAQQVVLKDMQRHAFKPKILHLDFMRIKAGEKITMTVPFHFINEDSAPGIKEGGIVSHLQNEVEISCLPKNLPEYIEVDVANLSLDQSLHLSDIQLPAGVEIVALAHEAGDNAIVNIHKAKVVVEEEPNETESSDNDSNTTDNSESGEK